MKDQRVLQWWDCCDMLKKKTNPPADLTSPVRVVENGWVEQWLFGWSRWPVAFHIRAAESAFATVQDVMIY
jgi:hypothetical protein